MRHHRVLSLIALAGATAWNTATAQSDKGRPSARAAFESAMKTLAVSPVSEGSFNAVVAPWVQEGKTTVEDMSRFAGSASVSKTGSVYTVVLCENRMTRGTNAFVSTLAFSQTPGRPSVNPDYNLPESGVTITVSGHGATFGSNPSGDLQISLVGASVAGVARLTFTQGKLVGATTSEPILVGISFRAPLRDAKTARRSCGAQQIPGAD